jgi:hypothetical protein
MHLAGNCGLECAKLGLLVAKLDHVVPLEWSRWARFDEMCEPSCGLM